MLWEEEILHKKNRERVCAPGGDLQGGCKADTYLLSFIPEQLAICIV